MAVAIPIATEPSTLLAGWQQDGWSVARQGVITQVPGDAMGYPTIPLQVDAFEWKDITFLGIGNTDDALARLRDYIQQGGSDLYAYALFQRDDFDAFGIQIRSYRLVLLHSIVQLLAGAVFILAAAFAAVIFIQYMTSGKSPALQDMQNLWGSSVTSLGQAAAQPVQAITNTYIWATLAAGSIALAFALAAKSAGTKIASPRLGGPRGSVGVRGGPVNARFGT